MPRSCPQPLISRPSTVTRPPFDGSSPIATRSAVVLPQPDGPISATISPSCTVKLTRSSACTWCTSPSTRNEKRLDTSTKLTSPMLDSGAGGRPSVRAADHLERPFADFGRDHGLDIEGRADLAGLHQLILHPGELFQRQRQRRIDGAMFDSIVIDEGRPRIVRLGMDDLTRQRH